jgi:hypothetical protein
MANTTFTRLGIINAALLAQGQTELGVENDGSLEWRTLAAQWPQLVEGEMEDAAMRHNIVEEEVATRAGAGKFGYSSRYLTPFDALHVRRVFVWDGAETSIRTYHDDWYQDANEIHVNADSGIWVEYVEVVDPDLFGPNFARGIQKKLEAVIARAIKEEHGLADRMDQEAEYFLQRARSASAGSKGPKPLFRPTSKFSDARFQRTRRAYTDG